jgi:hypothetical protein
LLASNFVKFFFASFQELKIYQMHFNGSNSQFNSCYLIRKPSRLSGHLPLLWCETKDIYSDNDAISFEASTAPALFSAFETPKADSFAAASSKNLSKILFARCN